MGQCGTRVRTDTFTTVMLFNTDLHYIRCLFMFLPVSAHYPHPGESIKFERADVYLMSDQERECAICFVE